MPPRDVRPNEVFRWLLSRRLSQARTLSAHGAEGENLPALLRLDSPGWGSLSTPPSGRRTRASARKSRRGKGDRGQVLAGQLGQDGARGREGVATADLTYIHYDGHASNESNKVKGESPTGKRKQMFLTRGTRGGAKGRTHTMGQAGGSPGRWMPRREAPV